MPRHWLDVTVCVTFAINGNISSTNYVHRFRYTKSVSELTVKHTGQIVTCVVRTVRLLRTHELFICVELIYDPDCNRACGVESEAVLGVWKASRRGVFGPRSPRPSRYLHTANSDLWGL